MGLQALGYEVAVGRATTSGTASRCISRVGLEDVAGRLRRDARPAATRRPRRRARSARSAAAYASGRSTSPTAARSTTRTTSTSSTGSARLRDAARGWLGEDTALVGDWNICPQDDDVFDIGAVREVDPRHPAGARGVRGLPRGRVRRRGAAAHAGAGVYTYWDYYRQRFERNRGMRIDFVLGSPSLAARVTGRVHRPRRAGRHRRLRPRPGGRRPRTDAPRVQSSAQLRRMTRMAGMCQRLQFAFGRRAPTVGGSPMLGTWRSCCWSSASSSARSWARWPGCSGPARVRSARRSSRRCRSGRPATR